MLSLKQALNTNANSFKKSITNLLFPSSCTICGSGEITNDLQWLCWNCRLNIQLIKAPFCERCGDPLDGTVFGEYLCIHCIEKQKKNKCHFDLARSAARYGGTLKEAILSFKYKKAFWLAEDLASFIFGIFNNVASKIEPNAITYVPLYHSRERQRTYNQAQLLAEALSKKVGLPLASTLKRHKFTGTQTQLTAQQRRDNVDGVFCCNNQQVVKKYKNFLIVDDVITTGATVEECAYTLKKYGAEKVIAMSVARG